MMAKVTSWFSCLYNLPLQWKPASPTHLDNTGNSTCPPALQNNHHLIWGLKRKPIICSKRLRSREDGNLASHIMWALPCMAQRGHLRHQTTRWDPESSSGRWLGSWRCTQEVTDYSQYFIKPNECPESDARSTSTKGQALNIVGSAGYTSLSV